MYTLNWAISNVQWNAQILRVQSHAFSQIPHIHQQIEDDCHPCVLASHSSVPVCHHHPQLCFGTLLKKFTEFRYSVGTGFFGSRLYFWVIQMVRICSTFVLIAIRISSCECAKIYPFYCWEAFGLLSVSGYSELCCYEHFFPPFYWETIVIHHWIGLRCTAWWLDLQILWSDSYNRFS